MLFDFEGPEGLSKRKGKSGVPKPHKIRGCSSAGRAPALHAGGQEFDPPHLHQRVKVDEEDREKPRLNGRIAQAVRAHA